MSVSALSTAASVASEKMEKKNPTNSKKKGGTKAVKKSAIKVSLLRLPVKKGEAQRSYKALEAKRAKDMKKAAAQRRREPCGHVHVNRAREHRVLPHRVRVQQA